MFKKVYQTTEGIAIIHHFDSIWRLDKVKINSKNTHSDAILILITPGQNYLFPKYIFTC